MKLNYSLRNSLIIGGVLFPLTVFSCSKGYYSDDLGICWPTGDTVVNNINPTTQISKMVALAQAITSGKGDDVKRALGDALINSSGCIACSGIAQTVLPTLSSEQVNKIVGQGFITFMMTGSPAIVTVDTVRQVLKETTLDPRENTPMNPVATPIIIKTYRTNADCIIKNKSSNAIIAGWKKPPILIDENGQSQVFPDTDINEKDTIKITAPLCPELNSKEQDSIANVSISYRFNNVIPGKDGSFKYIFYGGSLMEIIVPPHPQQPPPPSKPSPRT